MSYRWKNAAIRHLLGEHAFPLRSTVCFCFVFFSLLFKSDTERGIYCNSMTPCKLFYFFPVTVIVVSIIWSDLIQFFLKYNPWTPITPIFSAYDHLLGVSLWLLISFSV